MNRLFSALYARRHEAFVGVVAVIGLDYDKGTPHLTWRVAEALFIALASSSGVTAAVKTAATMKAAAVVEVTASPARLKPTPDTTTAN